MQEGKRPQKCDIFMKKSSAVDILDQGAYVRDIQSYE